MIRWKFTNNSTGESYLLNDSESVYDCVLGILGKLAEDAQGWSEIATVGEIYNEHGFSVEVVDLLSE